MNSDVIIPIIVINELDKKKVSPGEVGRNARVCCRLIDKASDLGDISTGVLLDNDILLKVDATYFDLTEAAYKGFGAPDYADTQILACVYNTYKQHPEDDITLVSNDVNLRIKAKSRGINAIEHEANKCSSSDLYSGNQNIINESAGFQLQKAGIIDSSFYGIDLSPHECISLKSNTGDDLALGRKIEDNKIKLIKKYYPWGVKSRNKEQSFAIDLMMDKSIDLVTFTGKAGTGKSFVVLASALELVIEKKEYEKLIIYRPIQAVSSDVGFLPGTLAEKLAPWFQAIMDNFEVLFSSKNSNDWKRELEMYSKRGRIEMDAITYIRGRSIPNAIILIDEAQNLDKEAIKTILTRAGENTKIVLTGDLDQIDNDKLDAINNGLTYVIEKFKNSDLAGHITFTQGERSRLATLASEIL